MTLKTWRLDLAPAALKENTCHVRTRAESLGNAEEARDWDRILDLDATAIDPSERQSRTETLVRRDVVTWLLRCSTREGLRIAEREERLKKALVDVRSREALLEVMGRSAIAPRSSSVVLRNR